MTQYLPPNLLALFAPRDPIQYLPPLDKLPHEKKFVPYSGVTGVLETFEDPKDTPPPTRVETKEERKERKRKERAEQVAYKLEQDLALWDPANDPNSTSESFKTLFVARINYDTSESKLRREFEVYGPVKKIGLTMNKKTNKPRGYAFIEYEHERDMHSAYKHADGKKIDGRRVLVDVERSRTVKGWRPRRLGGGLGGTRKGGPDENTKYSGRDDNIGAPGGRDQDRSPERDTPRRRGRSRSVSRNRERPPKRRSRSPIARRIKRSRSRERKRSRERGDEESVAGVEDTPGGRRRRRSRSRDRKRSRSRDRKRRRSRSPRDRKRSRSRERRRRDDGDYPLEVKEERFDAGYGDYPAEADGQGEYPQYPNNYNEENAGENGYNQGFPPGVPPIEHPKFKEEEEEEGGGARTKEES